MGRPALQAKDHPAHAAQLAEKRTLLQRKDALAGKTFEQLSPSEKDLLLKAVAVQLGWILDSQD